MDFIILKVNGKDLSTASHQQVLEAFNSASEPIFVEVARRYSISNTSVKPTIPFMMDLSVNIPTQSTNDYILPYPSSVFGQPLHGYINSSQKTNQINNHTDSNHSLSSYSNNCALKSFLNDAIKNRDDYSCGDLLKIEGILEEEEDAELDDDEEQVEIIKEEVVLRKKQSREIFGLTLSYSALSASDNSESEVYISAIEPNSVAKKEPNIRLGDQILQINNIDVHSKAQVVSLFQKCGLEVKLLLGRPNIISKFNGNTNRNGNYSSELPPLEEVEYASVYDEVEGNTNNENKFTQMDKDSGIGRGTDEANKTEESSECDSNQTSLKKSAQYQSSDSSGSRPDPQQIAQLMQHLAIEYQQLQKLLHGSSDSSIPRVQALPPPTLFQSTSRIVPRMGTKLDPPQTKSPIPLPPAASGSNTSAYSTGADSTRSSPLTMELPPTISSASFLSLKIDVRNNNYKFLDDNFNMSSTRTKYNLSNSDQKSTSGSSTNNLTESRMASSTILHQFSSTGFPEIPQHSSDDTECHYYDVYDPLTKSFNEKPKPMSRSNSQIEQNNCVEDHEYINAQLIKSDKLDSKMEWVVKKRPDGTRYITRRPIRNRMMKDREKKLNEERNYTTEEEDIHADLVLNRCWTKSDKRKYYDKVKDKKHKRKMITNCQPTDLPLNGQCSLKNDVYVANNRSFHKDFQNKNLINRNCDIAAFLVGSTMF